MSTHSRLTETFTNAAYLTLLTLELTPPQRHALEAATHNPSRNYWTVNVTDADFRAMLQLLRTEHAKSSTPTAEVAETYLLQQLEAAGLDHEPGDHPWYVRVWFTDGWHVHVGGRTADGADGQIDYRPEEHGGWDAELLEPDGGNAEDMYKGYTGGPRAIEDDTAALIGVLLRHAIEHTPAHRADS